MSDGLMKWHVQGLCLHLECHFQVLVEYEQAVALEPLVGQHLGLQHWSLWKELPAEDGQWRCDGLARFHSVVHVQAHYLNKELPRQIVVLAFLSC